MNTTVLFYVPIECEFGVMVSDLRQVGGFLRVQRFPPPRYN